MYRFLWDVLSRLFWRCNIVRFRLSKCVFFKESKIEMRRNFPVGRNICTVGDIAVVFSRIWLLSLSPFYSVSYGDTEAGGIIFGTAVALGCRCELVNQ